MALTPAQATWKRRAHAWARAHPVLRCRRCDGQALYGPDPYTLSLTWHCMQCSEDYEWRAPALVVMPSVKHLAQVVDLSTVPARTVLKVRTRLAQGAGAIEIAREFKLQRQVVTALRKAWEAEGALEGVG